MPKSSLSASLAGPAQGLFRRMIAVLGPGLMMAGAAIGVSHLVQSTRAGADYGFSLLWVIVLANILKYPFFEYGYRFTVATRQNLLQGYLRRSRWVLGLFFVLNIITSITSIAGVTFFSAALAENLFGFGFSYTLWSAVILVLSIGLYALGHYRYVEGAIKLMLAVLFVATLSAAVAAAINGPPASVPPPAGLPPELNIVFLVALLGWMPAPIEVSVWNSLWLQAKERDLGRTITLSEARWDFNIGYGLMIFLALVFMSLGALVVYGSGETLSNNGSVFSQQLVEIYGRTLGEVWMPVIAVAAFAAMLSSVLTVVDAYPRSLAAALALLAPRMKLSEERQHIGWMLVTSFSALLIISSLLDNLTRMVDLVTTIAFLSAPVFALMNYRLITSAQVDPAARPGWAMRALSWAGLLFLGGFSLFFLYNRYIAG